MQNCTSRRHPGMKKSTCSADWSDAVIAAAHSDTSGTTAGEHGSAPSTGAWGDSVCPSRQIPENILFKKTQDVLGTDGLSPEILAERIGKILVPEHHRLVFQLKDAPDTETRWKYPSRRDAWTKEKRQLAREQAYERLRERKEKK